MRKGAMLVGYARVSKADHQDTAAQVKALRKAGCERIFEEKASGGSWDRPQRLFFPNRTAQDFAPEREPRRYSLQEKAFDGLSKGRAYSAGQTRESGIVAARRGMRSHSRR
jgi:Resolvase, N terminal domain